MLVHAIGTPAFRLLLPAATSSAPLLIDLPTPSSESRGPEGAHAQSNKELRSDREAGMLSSRYGSKSLRTPLLALWNALPGVEKRKKVGDRDALIDPILNPAPLVSL